MQFFKSLLIGSAALVALVAAQEGIRLDSVPTSVQANEPVTVTYSGGDPNAVSFWSPFLLREDILTTRRSPSLWFFVGVTPTISIPSRPSLPVSLPTR